MRTDESNKTAYNNAPLVSVVVTVYNVEQYLKRCLNTLVFQTLDNIEILCVNDGSPDDSQKIIDEYVKLFPAKVRSLIKENGGLSSAREYGLKYAAAPYVTFVDSDDYLDYNFCELTYQKAVEENCDVVYAPHVEENANGLPISIKGTMPEDLSVASFIRDGVTSFCAKLFRTSFIRQHGKFLNMWYEDAASIPVTLTKANRIGYVKQPMYHYVRGNENSITASCNDKRQADTFLANDICISEVGDDYREDMYVRTSKRFFWSLKYDAIYDELIEHIKKYSYIFQESDYVKENLTDVQLERLEDFVFHPEPKIPCITYLNGFFDVSGSYLEEFESNSFLQGGELIVLSPDNCDVNASAIARQALEAKDFHFLGAYFALKKIYEQGGIFAEKNIVMHSTFNKTRFYDAFFGFLNREEISDCVFGGAEKSDLLGRIIRRIDASDYSETILSECIAKTLILEAGLPLSGKNYESPRFNAYVYAATAFSYNFEDVTQQNTLDISNHNYDGDIKSIRSERAAVPKASFEGWLNWNFEQLDELKNQRRTLLRKMKSYRDILDAVDTGDREKLYDSVRLSYDRELTALAEELRELEEEHKTLLCRMKTEQE